MRLNGKPGRSGDTRAWPKCHWTFVFSTLSLYCVVFVKFHHQIFVSLRSQHILHSVRETSPIARTRKCLLFARVPTKKVENGCRERRRRERENFGDFGSILSQKLAKMHVSDSLFWDFHLSVVFIILRFTFERRFHYFEIFISGSFSLCVFIIVPPPLRRHMSAICGGASELRKNPPGPLPSRS